MNSPYDLISELISKPLSTDEISQRLQDRLAGGDAQQWLSQIAEMFQFTGEILAINNRIYENAEIDSVIPHLLEAISKVLGSERTTLFVNDEAKNELVSRSAQGEWGQPIRIPNTWGIAGSVFTKGEGEIVNNLSSDPRFDEHVDKKTGFHTKNLISMPLRLRNGNIIGVLQSVNKKDGGFVQHDFFIMDAMSALVAVALRNGQLLVQLKSAEEEQDKMLTISKELMEDLVPQKLVEKSLDAIVTLLRTDRSTIFLYDQKGNDLWVLEAKGDVRKKIRFPSDQGAAGAAFKSGKAVNITDAYNDKRFNPEFDKKLGYHTQTLLCVPMIASSGKAMGVLQAVNKKGGYFSKTDEQRLMMLAKTVSKALEHSRQFKGQWD